MTDQLCKICGIEEDQADLVDGLCRICRTWPEGSYNWHLEMAEPEDAEDGFRSGWLRALSEIEKRLDGKTSLMGWDAIRKTIKELSEAYDNREL